MFSREEIAKVLQEENLDRPIIVMGWVRSFRNSQFIALNDGSTNNNLQIVVNQEIIDADTIKKIAIAKILAVTTSLYTVKKKMHKSNTVIEA